MLRAQTGKEFISCDAFREIRLHRTRHCQLQRLGENEATLAHLKHPRKVMTYSMFTLALLRWA